LKFLGGGGRKKGKKGKTPLAYCRGGGTGLRRVPTRIHFDYLKREKGKKGGEEEKIPKFLLRDVKGEILAHEKSLDREGEKKIFKHEKYKKRRTLRWQKR